MRRARSVMTSSLFVIAVFLIQGCAMRGWWGSESGQEELAQAELIKEPSIKEILPEGELTDSRANPSMRAELLSRNATGLGHGALDDVLFDFDRDALQADAIRVLEADAKQLQHDRVARLLLEGRGDEFGTSAYNLVLGERRAQNVKSYLRELGLSIEVTTTSYGKDRPLCFEHSGECLQKNRSVHLIVE